MIFFVTLLHIIVIGLLTLPFGLTLITIFKKSKKIAISDKHSNSPINYACIITAYRHSDIALPLVQSLLQQNYPQHTIYLVADQCTDLTIWHNFSLSPSAQFQLLVPPQALQSKVKSMQYALAHFQQEHSHIVVFDPDNLAKPDFLSQINPYIQAGYAAVQGKRIAKNLDTHYACADALGEIYKNYIERYVPFQLGSSATIAGSGMAVAAPLFANFLTSPDISQRQAAQQVVAAEDKILQNYLVAQKQIIAFAPEAQLYDEKVQLGEQVTRQRTRWLFAYFENVGKALQHLYKGIMQANWNRFLFGSLSIIPPLFILLSAALFLAAIDLSVIFFKGISFADFITGIAPADNAFWCAIFLAICAAIVTFAFNILLSLYLDQAPKAIWLTVLKLPLFIGRQLLSLLQIKKAKSDFLTTQHRQVMSLEQVQQNKP
jgi:cellulose synthase/poly-beta-1,6-N-acetylglucosamine synthase-like glycosyltransferase